MISPSQIEQRTDRATARVVPIVTSWIAALLWLSNVNWKVPPDFGETGVRCSGLCGFVQTGIDHPVAPGSAWVLDNVVQSQLELFGWITLFAEVTLAALLLSGRYLRIAAVLGVVQSLAIGLTVANAPDEWYWAYLLMVGLHLAVLAFAPRLRPLGPRTMALITGIYGLIVAAAHAEAGFTGDSNEKWSIFTGGNDVPDEFGRGTFSGSIALGLLLVGLAVVVWLLASTDARARRALGTVTIAASVVLLLTYDSDGLLLGLGSRAVTAVVIAALGLSLLPARALHR